MTTAKDCYNSYQESLSGLLSQFPFYYSFINQSPYIEANDVAVAALKLVPGSTNTKLALNPEEFPQYDLKDRMFFLAKQIIHIIRLHALSTNAKSELWKIAMEMDAVSTLMAQTRGPKEPPYFQLPKDLNDPGRPAVLTIDGVAKQIEAMWAAKGVVKQIAPPPPELAAASYFKWLTDNVPAEANEPGPGDEEDEPTEGDFQKPPKSDENQEPEEGEEGESDSEDGDGDSDEQDDKGLEGNGDNEDDQEGEGDAPPPEDAPGKSGNEADNDKESSGDNPSSKPSSSPPKQGKAKGGAPTPRDLMEELLEKAKHDLPDLTPEDREILKYMITEQATRAAEQSNPPGNLSGLINELIEATKPKETLERFLQKFVGMLGSLDGRTTMARRNKYGSFPRYVFRPRKKLIAMIDSSGSVDSRWISIALGHLDRLSANCQIDIMWIDCEVHEIISLDEAKRRAKLGDDKGRKGFQVKGRGGTSMRVGFRYIRDRKVHTDGILCFSDLELGPYNGPKGNFGFPNREELAGHRTLWIGLKGDAESHPVPPSAGPVVYTTPDGHVIRPT